MSSGPRNVTSTTNQEPPAFLRGPLTTAVNAAQSQFLGGATPPQYPTQGGGSIGGSISDFMGRVAGGNNQQPTQPTGPVPSGNSDLIGQSQGLISDTIGGNFLNPSTNPYLEGTFNRAADLTRTRLSSEFGGAGRNQGAAAPARSDELQTLASNIYGGNYQAERDRQVNASNQSLDFDPLNLFINRLGGIIPGAGGTTTATQPVYRTGIFSDRRLKENIRRIGTIKGLPWYSFDYLWGEHSEGFMSDEVPAQFVFQDESGYDMIDYNSMLHVN